MGVWGRKGKKVLLRKKKKRERERKCISFLFVRSLRKNEKKKFSPWLEARKKKKKKERK